MNTNESPPGGLPNHFTALWKNYVNISEFKPTKLAEMSSGSQLSRTGSGRLKIGAKAFLKRMESIKNKKHKKIKDKDIGSPKVIILP